MNKNNYKKIFFYLSVVSLFFALFCFERYFKVWGSIEILIINGAKAFTPCFPETGLRCSSGEYGDIFFLKAGIVSSIIFIVSAFSYFLLKRKQNA